MKELNLLNVSDMFSLKILNFLHKLSHDDLPLYFDIYRSYLNKIVTPYSLGMHPLPLPVIAHTFAESSLVFHLVKMKNNISVNDTLILKRIEERSHSHSGFSTYVKNTMLSRYKYECSIYACRTCEQMTYIIKLSVHFMIVCKVNIIYHYKLLQFPQSCSSHDCLKLCNLMF